MIWADSYDYVFQINILPVQHIMKAESNIWNQNIVRLWKIENKQGIRIKTDF